MTREFANIHADLCELRRMIAAEHSNDGAWTAVDYLDEARQLIEAADAIVRREHAKKVPPRDLATLH